MPGIGLKIDPVGENNLISNSGFEAGTTGWTAGAPSWASSSFTNPTASFAGSLGAKTARIQATKDATATLRTATVSTTTPQSSVVPGGEYALSVPVQVVDASSGGVLAYVNWLDAAGAFISTSTTTPTFAGTGTGVLAVSGLIAPATAASAQAVVQFSSNVTGDTVDIYFDVAQLGTGMFDINDGTKFRAMKASYPTPPRKVNWTSSADTEGALPASLQYENRTITIECRVYGSSAADLQTQLGYLEQKVGKINEVEGVGGTHEYVSPSGATCIFDLFEASADYELDNAALANKRTTVTITFTAKPFWRAGMANEVAGADHPETTKPAVIGLDTVEAGDVPALARLVVDEDQGADQWSLLWGLQSRTYSASPDAELFYEAESRTLQGGSELKALAGASGSGSNAVFNALLFPTLQPILSTQKVGGGNHFSHSGTYRVFARLFRPTTNLGEVSVAFQWAQGDFQQSTLNAEKHWEANEFEGAFTMTDLGLVNIEKAPSGAQRWEGHVLAKSTYPGDDIYIDCLFLFPVDEGYGALKMEPTASSLTTVSAHDEFDQTAGNLDLPKVMPVGGSWSEAGKVGAEGFTVNSTFKWAQRTIVSDATGTWAIAGTTTSPFAAVSALLSATALVYFESQQGLFLRYTNTSNWLKAVIRGGPISKEVAVDVYKMVAGVQTPIDGLGEVLGGITSFSQLKLTLMAFPSGRYRVVCNGHILDDYDADLATGGALATGKAGMYDQWGSSKACTRSFDNFELLTGAADAAVYASRSAEIRSDSVQRQDSTGTVVSPRPDYKGAYILMPPSRREARPVRTIVKLSRGEIDALPDSAIDDASFRIFWQARGLVLPES